uniref:DNA damage-binding protein 2 n=1 Tax=Anthurium amnicola TaxID=1678845 RepID=A0A1D1Y1N6_9ARAE
MAADLCHLEARYVNSCRSQQLQPNTSILSSFSKAKLKRSRQEFCNLEITLDHLIHSDFPPLIEALSASKLSGIDAVDVCQESCGVLPSGEDVLALLDVIDERLRFVNLSTFWKDIVRDISRRGLNCQILDLRFSPIRRLNMTGNFMQLHTLNLDFSTSLTSIREGCFSCMPNLMCLSMCETRITNLSMTSAALSKLPSLVELRFQNCLCCYDTRPCPTSSCGETLFLAHEEILRGHENSYTNAEPSLVATENCLHQTMRRHSDEEILLSDDESFINHEYAQSTTESSDESELDFSGSHQGTGIWLESLSHDRSDVDRLTNLEITVNKPRNGFSLISNSSVSMSAHPFEEDINSSDNTTGIKLEHSTTESDTIADPKITFSSNLASVEESYRQSKFHSRPSDRELLKKDEEGSSKNVLNMIRSLDLVPKKLISHHPSPICFEKNYREYMIASSPRLEVLDNVSVSNMERDKSKIVFTERYEYLPYNRRQKESVVGILQKREMGTTMGLGRSHMRQPYPSWPSTHSFSRSLAAAKVGSNPWPRAKAVSKFKGIINEEDKSFRPRQFEYHPSDPSLMVFGTLDGELVVINHESGKLVAYLPSAGALNSILGLCWLKKHPSKLIAGSDNGSLLLYDVNHMPATLTDRYCSTDAISFSFDEFEQLTSVHANSTDECFLASGFSKHVALYDISSGRRLQVFKDMHREHINVVKFACHSPTVFATASFDHEVKLWDLRQGMLHPCYTTFSSRGNVMVCFSHDDHYLLSSAVDNEVKQHLAVDGRLHLSFRISPTGSAQNYTRSYYMNGRDYIISGSCEENVVRICCAQTGRRLRDISLEGRGMKNSMFVQSLRGDPFRVFHMSVLAAYLRPRSKSEIVKVNLVESSDFIEDNSCVRGWKPSYGMGG